MIKVIFIVGAGHSGSTLLDLILNSHKEVTGIGELSDIDKNNVCTCGKVLYECEIWKEVVKDFENLPQIKIKRKLIDCTLNSNNYYVKKIDLIRIKKKLKNNNIFQLYRENLGDNFVDLPLNSLSNYFKGSNLPILLQFIIDINYEIYRRISRKTKTKIIVDSSKDIIRALILAKHPKIKPYFIHLYRDGRGVAYSNFKKFNRNPLNYMIKWFYTNLKIEIIKRKNFKYFSTIRYKDLCKNPKKEIGKILRFYDLALRNDIMSFRNASIHQVEGNRMRFQNTEKIIEDLSWKKYLPKPYVFIFNIIFNWFNIYYKFYEILRKQ